MNFHNEIGRFAVETVSSESGQGIPADRPELLISVRDRAEFRHLLDSDVDIIDLKEPRRGALSPTDSQLWQQVAQEWSDRASVAPSSQLSASCQLSAALGESAEARALAQLLPAEFHFAKAGPSRCSTEEALLRLWTDVRNRLDPAVELVAVAYADHEDAECPPPEQVLRAARDFGLRRCLLDTFTKDRRSSIERLGQRQLQSFSKIAKQLDMWWVLAGSIRVQEIGSLLASEIVPDCFGVRGDVCLQSREGQLCPDRVGGWIATLNACELKGEKTRQCE